MNTNPAWSSLDTWRSWLASTPQMYWPVPHMAYFDQVPTESGILRFPTKNLPFEHTPSILLKPVWSSPARALNSILALYPFRTSVPLHVFQRSQLPGYGWARVMMCSGCVLLDPSRLQPILKPFIAVSSPSPCGTWYLMMNWKAKVLSGHILKSPVTDVLYNLGSSCKEWCKTPEKVAWKNPINKMKQRWNRWLVSFNMSQGRTSSYCRW